MLRKKNGTIVCPVAGCNKPIKTADLQKDAEKVVALRRLDKAAAASQRAAKPDAEAQARSPPPLVAPAPRPRVTSYD